MIKVAFCDDDLDVLNEIRVFLDRYRVERNEEISYTAFQSPLDLMAKVEKGARFDVLFLDVIMPGENGIDVAEEIRNYDSNIKIIFLTSSNEFAVQSYIVHAYFYQLKPVEEESFFRLMDSVLATCEKEQRSCLVIKCKNGISCIDPKKLEYCEVICRTLYLHFVDGTVLETIGSMDELSRQLTSYGGFIRPHRSYLINLEYVQNIFCRSMTMSCQAEIPIPRGKYNEIKNAFLKYAFENRRVII